MRMRVLAAALLIGTLPGVQAWAQSSPPPALPTLQETPSLAEQVKAGTLPPVAKRVPEQPSVVRRFAGPDGPGHSGGQVNMLVGTARDTRLMTIYANARLIGVLTRQQARVDALSREVTDLHRKIHALCDRVEVLTANQKHGALFLSPRPRST